MSDLWRKEVSLAGKPKPSLQGSIYGVFWNRLLMRGEQLRRWLYSI